MESSIALYEMLLLPYLQEQTTVDQKRKISSYKRCRTKPFPRLNFIHEQRYKGSNRELKTQGFTVVKNVFKDRSHLNLIHRLADVYDMNMCEFVDKEERMEKLITPLLQSPEFVDLYRDIYGTPFLWQKATLHRKGPKVSISEDTDILSRETCTGEHMDITETPNSKLTITAYIALSNQTAEKVSKLLVYPKSHLQTPLIPLDNFEYVHDSRARSINLVLLSTINKIVENKPELEWARECLYHLIVLDIPKFNILKSTFTLLLFNPELFDIEPVAISLEPGDVLFFVSNLLHGSTPHLSKYDSRVSLAVRGGYPYYEKSDLIGSCVRKEFYKKHASIKKDHFLFTGTTKMIAEIKDRDRFRDIIYPLPGVSIKEI